MTEKAEPLQVGESILISSESGVGRCQNSMLRLEEGLYPFSGPSTRSLIPRTVKIATLTGYLLKLQSLQNTRTL